MTPTVLPQRQIVSSSLPWNASKPLPVRVRVRVRAGVRARARARARG